MNIMNMKSRIPAIVYVKGFAMRSFGHAAVKKTQGRGLVTPTAMRSERKKERNKILLMITYWKLKEEHEEMNLLDRNGLLDKLSECKDWDNNISQDKGILLWHYTELEHCLNYTVRCYQYNKDLQYDNIWLYLVHWHILIDMLARSNSIFRIVNLLDYLGEQILMS